jgi:hypothetical protein
VLRVADPKRVLHQVLAMQVGLEQLLLQAPVSSMVRPILTGLLMALEVLPRSLSVAATGALVRLSLELPRLALLVVVAAVPNLDWSIVAAVAAPDCSRYFRLAVLAPGLHVRQEEHLMLSMVRLRPNGRRRACPCRHRLG